MLLTKIVKVIIVAKKIEILKHAIWEHLIFCWREKMKACTREVGNVGDNIVLWKGTIAIYN